MGKRKHTKEQIENVKKILLLYKNQVFKNGKVVSKNDQIWHNMSIETSENFTPLALFTVVSKNYYDSHSLLFNNQEHQLEKNNTNENIPSDSSYQENQSSTTDSSECSTNNSNDSRYSFFVTLNYSEYLNLNPHITKYKRTDKYEKKTNLRKSKQRAYISLEPKYWSNILHNKIEKALRSLGYKCTFIFKRCKITLCGKYFATIYGLCKECKSVLSGYIETEPGENENVTIIFECMGNFSITHNIAKRPIFGSERKKIGEELITTNIAPSQYRRLRAVNEIQEGIESSSLPKLEVIRKIKHESQSELRLNKDPILAVQILKNNPDMKGCIKNIGLDPFFVYLWTNTQLHVFNKYCKEDYGILSIDATGGIVRSATKPSGDKTKHIFLYEGTIRHKHLKKENQYPVTSMLSEAHNSVAIYTWLAHWIKNGAENPKEIVCDMSLALLYAIILAFTSCKTLEQYLQICFEAIFFQQPFNEKCFIRLDIAHFQATVSRFSCMKKQHRLTRQFYLRAVGQLCQCTNVEDVQNMLEAIFTVAYSDTEGKSLITGINIKCEEHKQWLIRRCSSGTTETLDIELKIVNNEMELENFKEKIKSPFEDWARNIAVKCKTLVNTQNEVGDRGNQQCLPLFVNELLKLLKLLPLWSAILIPHFPKAQVTASSSISESNFNHIKNRVFSNVTLPVRIDEFIPTYILSNYGAVQIAKASIQQKKDIDDKILPAAILDENCKNNDNSQDEVDNEEKPKPKCPSCELKLAETSICCNCQNPIHNHPLCSQQNFCNRCFNMEQNQIENWKGKAIPTRKRTCYLEPLAELMSTDFSNTKLVPVGLLRNGHLMDLKPIKIGQECVTLSNTCGFDAVVQVLACAFCDSQTFKDLLILFSKNQSKIATIVCTLVEQGINKKIYRLRAELCYKVFPKNETPKNIVAIDVQIQISNLLNGILDFYSGVKSNYCPACKDVQNESITFIEIEITNIYNLEALINEQVAPNYFFRCHKGICKGYLRRKLDLNPVCFFIEPINTATRMCEIQCKLEDIPKTISIGEIQYILRGCVAYTGPDLALGHFTAFANRHNNIWEVYDDTHHKSEKCSRHREVKIQTLFYSI
ncbi:unnamed protein product [Psylliodes chrysocephalus]|uniref:USP domain-containing protein n=1 Tax=Psylliodes chrysocephalus TaxID=3402493 RepID=A0A9P0D738_9CUCU|nr:unnamed protein product [Psylliodes chrysocephala]